MVRLQLLGCFNCEVAGERVRFTSKKSQALLTFLATHANQGRSRDELASLLWNDCAENLARSNLRQTLTQLRKTLRSVDQLTAASVTDPTLTSTVQLTPDCAADDFLLATSESISLDSSKIDIDIIQFRKLSNTDSVDAWQSADAIYRGALHKVQLPHEPIYDEWIAQEIRIFSEQHKSVLCKLLVHYESSQSHTPWIDTGHRLLSIDPLQENIHRSLIRAYHQTGDRSAALRQYSACSKALQNELNIEPGASTQELHKEILQSYNEEHSQTLLYGVEKKLGDRFNLVEKDTQLSERNQDRSSDLSGHSDEQKLSLPGIVVLAKKTLAKRLFKISKLAPLLVVAMVSMAGYVVYQAQSSDTSNVDTSTSINNIADRYSKASIIVFPFQTIGEDTEQRYFSNGLTEDLITRLARFSALKVIAPYSSFSLENPQQEFVDVAQSLGVKYLLRGSVQRSGEKLRVHTTLINATSGTTLWSRRFDEQFSDIFQLQDELVRSITTELSVNLTDNEQMRFDRVKAHDPDAYDLLLRGLEPLRHFTGAGLAEARSFFERAIKIDPTYARAYGNLALTYGTEIVFRLSDDPEESLKRGMLFIAEAERLDDAIPQIQFAKAVLNLAARNYDQAVAAAQLAIALEPNYADGYAVLAQTSSYSGELENALSSIRQAIELSPVTPFSYRWVEAHTLYLMNDYHTALANLKKIVSSNPSFVQGQLLLAATYGQLGLVEDSAWHRDEVLTQVPDFSLADELERAPYRFEHHRKQFAEGLIRAGFLN